MLEEIGNLGDEQLNSPQLTDVDRVDDPGPPYWSLLFWLCRFVEWRKPAYVDQPIRRLGLYSLAALCCMVIVPIDSIHALLRSICLFCLWGLWHAERRVAAWQGRSYFCRVCLHPMAEPFVYCQKCGRIQGRLRPTIHTLLVKRCSKCHGSKWNVLGNYLWRTPSPLVCRDTGTSTGCGRPCQGELAPIMGRYCHGHIAIMGPGVRAKHALFAHLAAHLIHSSDGRFVREPVCRLTHLEWQLCCSQLHRSFQDNTAACEKPGQDYTLARGFLLKDKKNEWLALHNLVVPVVSHEELLYLRGVYWPRITALILVIEEDVLRQDARFKQRGHVEIFSRTLRVVEKSMGLLLGDDLPFKVAVVMPVRWSGPAIAPSAAIPAEEVRRMTKELAPGFEALVECRVADRQLRFFGGAIPPVFDPSLTPWLDDLIRWVL